MKLLFCWIAAVYGCLAQEAPVVMGSDWFAKLRDPKTRVEALYQSKKAHAEKGEELPDLEEFAAGHRRVWVFPCPQPGHPDAWAVVNPVIWKESRANLRGLEVEAYDPHPLEVERRRKWDAELENLTADFKPWQTGQAWFDTLSGDLVDPTGKELGGFFASPGILADFNGDGMLDVVQIERISIKVGGNGWDSVIDGVSIGPLDGEKPRYGMVYANLRKFDHKTPRTWRFAVRGEAGDLRLALVPDARDRQEIRFGFRDGALTADVEKLPNEILLDTHPEGESYFASKKFLIAHGHETAGVGSDDACEVLADFPVQPPAFSFESLKITLPETGDAAPREAAKAPASHVFDNAFYRSQYELATVGDPAPPATRGWLELWCDGGGWGAESVDVWWLDGETAERWTQQGPATFLATRQSSADLGRRIALAHEIDRIRTVPLHPFPAVADHKRMGGRRRSPIPGAGRDEISGERRDRLRGMHSFILAVDRARV